MLTASLDLSQFRADVERTRRTIKLGIARGVGKAAAEGAQEAKRSGRFKNRTGELRRSIVARFLSDTGASVEWEILSPARYSKFIEEGTRPHDIWPKAGHGLKGPLRSGQTRRATGKGPHEHIVGRGQALRFMVGGRWVFARMVHHPGAAADPYMSQAYTKGFAVLVRELETMTANVANIWR